MSLYKQDGIKPGNLTVMTEVQGLHSKPLHTHKRGLEIKSVPFTNYIRLCYRAVYLIYLLSHTYIDGLWKCADSFSMWGHYLHVSCGHWRYRISGHAGTIICYSGGLLLLCSVFCIVCRWVYRGRGLCVAVFCLCFCICMFLHITHYCVLTNEKNKVKHVYL